MSMTDRYNFNYESDSFGETTNLGDEMLKCVVAAGNNPAYLDMAIGVINELNIEIGFFVAD